MRAPAAPSSSGVAPAPYVHGQWPLLRHDQSRPEQLDRSTAQVPKHCPTAGHRQRLTRTDDLLSGAPVAEHLAHAPGVAEAGDATLVLVETVEEVGQEPSVGCGRDVHVHRVIMGVRRGTLA